MNACQVCTKTAETGVCKAENAACAADAECKAFESCRNGCSTQECIDQNCLSLLLEQSDFDLYNAQSYCLCNENACFDECKCQ